MAKWLKLYATYTFSTSPNLCHRTTLLNLNTDVQNCYITKIQMGTSSPTTSTQHTFVLMLYRIQCSGSNVYSTLPQHNRGPHQRTRNQIHTVSLQCKAHLTNLRIWPNAQRIWPIGKMRGIWPIAPNARALGQMRNVWPNARAFGQMRSAFNQCRTPKFKPAAIDELRSAFGHWCKWSASARRYAIMRNRCDGPHGKS